MSCHANKMTNKLCTDDSMEPLISVENAPDVSRGDDPRDSKTTTIGVIGTGNYALALTKRLILSGYQVIIGSRRPDARRSTLPISSDCLCGVELSTIASCICRCDVIFVAIHGEDFRITLSRFSEETRGKILVDVSNRDYRYAATSNAETLQSILRHSIVVKAFNSLSAHAMEQLINMNNDNQKVFVASNSIKARAVVSEIAKTIGFMVIDLGRLKSARYMEDHVLKVFTLWKIPICVTFFIFNLWLLFAVYLYYMEREVYSWEQLFLKVLNKPLCMTAITVLALTYLPGQLAAILQLYRGTKHQRFPRLLDTWLRSRKQLGLIGFLLVTFHVIASTMMLSPTYYRSWFHQPTVTFNPNTTLTSEQAVTLAVSRTWMVWKGEAACVVGISAYLLLCIVAVTSIPSVGESLNWSEWRCIHSKLSYFVLFLSLAHVCIMGAPGWAKTPGKIHKSITFLSALLPAFVLILKILFSLPPLHGMLRKIRRGWERGHDESVAGDAAASKGHNLREVKTCSGVNLSKSCGCSKAKGTGSCGAADAPSSEKCQCSSC